MRPKQRSELMRGERLGLKYMTLMLGLGQMYRLRLEVLAREEAEVRVKAGNGSSIVTVDDDACSTFIIRLHKLSNKKIII